MFCIIDVRPHPQSWRKARSCLDPTEAITITTIYMHWRPRDMRTSFINWSLGIYEISYPKCTIQAPGFGLGAKCMFRYLQLTQGCDDQHFRGEIKIPFSGVTILCKAFCFVCCSSECRIRCFASGESPPPPNLIKGTRVSQSGLINTPRTVFAAGGDRQWITSGDERYVCMIIVLIIRDLHQRMYIDS